LGCIVKNVAFQNFKIDSINLGQHKTRLMKKFHLKFYIKKNPNHIQFEISIGLLKTISNEWLGEKKSKK
jgi:hypothetical protein